MVAVSALILAAVLLFSSPKYCKGIYTDLIRIMTAHKRRRGRREREKRVESDIREETAADYRHSLRAALSAQKEFKEEKKKEEGLVGVGKVPLG